MIGQGVENVYLFDTDGYGYNERTGLFYLKENERTQAIFDAVVGATDTLIYLDGRSNRPVPAAWDRCIANSHSQRFRLYGD